MNTAHHSTEECEYLLGTRDDELLRLGFQHQVWAEQTARGWRHGGFRPGHHLLDVGSGPGYATMDLARLAGPAGSVLAVDVSHRFLENLRARAAAQGIDNIRTELRDVEHLDLAAEQFDGAFARWVLCFTPHPEAVVAGVAAGLKPGGRFAVLDYCRYEAFTVAPRSEAIEMVIRATSESFRLHGGNPDVGQTLPRLM